MREVEMQLLVRERTGLRIGRAMSEYLLAKWAESKGPVAVMGLDARTGVPRREFVEPHLLQGELK